MSILKQICTDKADHVSSCKQRLSFEDLHAHASIAPKPLGFIKAIKSANNNDKPAIIAEVKKASPSKGVICLDFDPVNIAMGYQQNGASCISVLTDQAYFQGCDDDFNAVRKITNIPMIRKDFMIDPYQIVESRAMGADCILIIMAALDDVQAKEIADTANQYGMDILFETHNAEEMERARALSAEMVGLNSRNLKTLDVNIEIFNSLFDDLPEASVKIAESGIQGCETIINLHKTGYNGFLIGESLMKNAHQLKDLSELLKT